VITQALEKHKDLIATEVLATTIHINEEPPSDAANATVDVEDGSVRIALRRA
jgi:hypothetical protein